MQLRLRTVCLLNDEPQVDNDEEGAYDGPLRSYSIGLFRLLPDDVVSLRLPEDAELAQVISVDNDPYAVFVMKELTDEELAAREQQAEFFTNLLSKKDKNEG